ncbi:MAG: alpha/beta hydrolase [Tannerellaceae bacterium]|jgi:pimeloyl-ACP methyl ester carboxylesterase|nr:alpha/beta hydrolase [Tannerellaceae bacterium]
MKENKKLNMRINATVERKTLAKDGYSVHYFVSGNKNGEAIAFLHPAFSCHRCFDKQVDDFSKQYRVITIDMLGHGSTGVGKSKDKIASTSIHLAEIIAQENIKRVHVVGVSLGSLLAQDFALKYPNKTHSLTVLGGYNIHREQKAIAKLQQREMFKWLLKIIFSMDAFRRYTASKAVIDKLEQVHFYESAKQFTRKSFTVMSGLDKLTADKPHIQSSYPLLILSGDNDVELSITLAKQWHEDIPGSEIHIIENAGHCANMDNPERFNEILMEFISRIRS